LDKEKRDLLQENTQLRAVLKQYLDGNTPHAARYFKRKSSFSTTLIPL
jgi:hypothetical protein